MAADIQAVRPVVHVYSGAPVERRRQFEARVRSDLPVGLGIEYAVAGATGPELELVEATLDEDLTRHGAGDSASLRSLLEMAGLRNPRLGTSRETGTFVAAIDENVSELQRLAAQSIVDTWVSTLIGHTVPFLIEVADPPEEATDRDSNPAQLAGGVKITSCTAGFSVRVPSFPGGDQARITTAAHCGGVPTPFWHFNESIGPVSECHHSAGFTGCSTSTTAGVDVALINPTADGLASEYTLINPPSSGTGAANFRLAMTSTYSSNSLPSTLWVCNEGASSIRMASWGSYDESCGWGTGVTSDGYGQARVVTCRGDSGATVRSGQVILGIVHAENDQGTLPVNCGRNLFVSSVSRIMARLGGSTSVILASGGASDPRPSTRSALVNSYGKCLSSSSASYANGIGYQQRACVAGDASQMFGLVPVGGHGPDAFLLVRWDGLNRTCLSVSGSEAGGYGPGSSLVHGWDCYGGGNTLQVWRLEWNPAPPALVSASGWMNIRSVASGKCLSIPFSDAATLLQLHIWECYAGTPAQRWRLS